MERSDQDHYLKRVFKHAKVQVNKRQTKNYGLTLTLNLGSTSTTVWDMSVAAEVLL